MVALSSRRQRGACWASTVGPSPDVPCDMARRSLHLVVLVLIAACGPSDPSPATGTDPGSTSATTVATDDPAPVTTTSAESTSSGDVTGDVSGTTQSGPTTGDVSGTTQQSASTTGLTEVVDTTGADTTTTGETTGETTGGTESTDGTTSDTSDIPDTTGGELCEGAPDEADLVWSLEVPPALAGQDISADCQVVSADTMAPDIAVNLGCVIEGELNELVLNYTIKPERKLVWNPGDPAQLTYRSEDAPWDREWLTLQTALTDLWAVRADALAPPGVEVEDHYGRQITIVAPCDPEPDLCGQRQDLEVRVSHYFEDIPTYLPLRSGQWGIYGFPVPTLVWLERASRLLEPIECDGAAPVRLEMILVDDASGF